mgnify:CR=1 FL=1
MWAKKERRERNSENSVLASALATSHEIIIAAQLREAKGITLAESKKKKETIIIYKL